MSSKDEGVSLYCPSRRITSAIGQAPSSRWFIENGRFHAGQIMKHIAHGAVEPLALEEKHWKTAE